MVIHKWLQRLKKLSYTLIRHRYWLALRYFVFPTIEHEALFKNYKFATVFDVGANVGEYTLVAKQLNPSCRIYAFEIVPKTFSLLLENTKHLSQVVHVNKGLSDENGSLDIFIGGGSLTSTAFKIDADASHQRTYGSTVECQAIKAADYIVSEEIARVDFVKIDTEGMDLRVIKGFEAHLDKVSAIQFEYGIFNIASHDLLADFCDYLAKRNFVVGKIFPKKVEFFDYDFHMENFHGGNFIAVKRSEANLISALQ